MLYHGVNTFSIIQFDYYGDSIFIASIFNDYAIECEYPQICPKKFFETENCVNHYYTRYTESDGTIAYNKRAARFCFNVEMNIGEYYEIHLQNSYECGSVKKLVRHIVVLLISF